MADENQLSGRIDAIIRQSAEDQAKAYQEYGGLLDQLASRKIRTGEFARRAADLYIEALGKAASRSVSLFGESLAAGVREAGAVQPGSPAGDARAGQGGEASPGPA